MSTKTKVRGEKRKAEEGGDNDHERELEEIMGPKKRLKIDSKTQDILDLLAEAPKAQTKMVKETIQKSLEKRMEGIPNPRAALSCFSYEIEELWKKIYEKDSEIEKLQRLQLPLPSSNEVLDGKFPAAEKELKQTVEELTHLKTEHEALEHRAQELEQEAVQLKLKLEASQQEKDALFEIKLGQVVDGTIEKTVFKTLIQDMGFNMGNEAKGDIWGMIGESPEKKMELWLGAGQRAPGKLNKKIAMMHWAERKAGAGWVLSADGPQKSVMEARHVKFRLQRLPQTDAEASDLDYFVNCLFPEMENSVFAEKLRAQRDP